MCTMCVVTQVLQPLEDVLPYEHFSLRYTTHDIPRLAEMLE